MPVHDKPDPSIIIINDVGRIQKASNWAQGIAYTTTVEANAKTQS